MFTPENIKTNDSKINTLTMTLYKTLQEFYSDPENVRKFEEWKKQRDKNKEE